MVKHKNEFLFALSRANTQIRGQKRNVVKRSIGRSSSSNLVYVCLFDHCITFVPSGRPHNHSEYFDI